MRFFFSSLPRSDGSGPQAVFCPMDTEGSYPEIKVTEPGRKADHSSPSNVDVKNAWSYDSTPPTRLNGFLFSSAYGHLYLG
jgi:hypothetical protein